MLPLERELAIHETPSGDRDQILSPKPRKLVEEIDKSFALAFAELSGAVVGREATRCALREDELRARDPIGTLAVDEMADDNVGAPRVRPFGRGGPHGGEPGKHRAQSGRRAFEDRDAGC